MDKISIVSNVMHDELYEHSKSFFDSMRYEKTVVSGKNGMYGFEAISPFFMVMNVGEVRKKYDIEKIGCSMYASDLDKYIPTKLIKTGHFIYDNFEFCYRLFFWLLRNGFKLLYLDVGEHTDNLTTIVKNQDGVPFAYHTWFARKWDTRSRKRIKSVIEYCNKIKS